MNSTNPNCFSILTLWIWTACEFLGRNNFHTTLLIVCSYVAKFHKIGPTPANLVKDKTEHTSKQREDAEVIDKTPIVDEDNPVEDGFGGFDDQEDEEYIQRAKRNAMRKRGIDPHALDKPKGQEKTQEKTPKALVKVSETVSETIQEKVEEKPSKKSKGKTLKTVEKVSEKVHEKIEEKVQEKPSGKAQGKAQKKAEVKVSIKSQEETITVTEKTQKKASKKTEEKVEEKADDKVQKAEAKPKAKSTSGTKEKLANRSKPKTNKSKA